MSDFHLDIVLQGTEDDLRKALSERVGRPISGPVDTHLVIPEPKERYHTIAFNRVMLGAIVSRKMDGSSVVSIVPFSEIIRLRDRT